MAKVIFYLVMIIRAGSKSVKKIEQVIDSIHDIVKTTKEKLEHSAAYVSVLGEGFKKVMEVVKEQSGSTTKKRKKK